MIRIAIHHACDTVDVSVPRIKALIRAVCRRYGLDSVQVSVAIVDDTETRRINRTYLDRTGSTDCFSFDLSDGGQTVFEVVVNGDRAVQEAQRRGHGVEAELALYVTHGLLHLLGFDDLTEDQAVRMHAEEDAVLQALGYGTVYQSNRVS